MNSPITRIRTLLIDKGGRVFSYPYLPDGMIIFALLVVVTNACVIIIVQPPIFWFDSSYAENSYPFLLAILRSGVWAFWGICLLYLGLVWTIIGLFNRSVALVAWITLTTVHLQATLLELGQILLPEEMSSSPMFGTSATGLCALVIGIVLATILLKSADKSIVPMVQKRWRRGGGIVTVVWLILLTGIMVLNLARAPKNGWQIIETKTSPGPRHSVSIAYDKERDRAVLFGGASEWIGTAWVSDNDTWEWDGDNWIKLEPTLSPHPRYGHAMAYDEKRGVIVMFGGQGEYGLLADTWEWDGENWLNVYTVGFAPPARIGHQMFYDRSRGRVMLSGGFNDAIEEETTFYGDYWEWDGQKWIPIGVESVFNTITGFGVAYDQNKQNWLAVSSAGIHYWEDDQWVLSSGDDTSPFRHQPSMVNDPSSEIILLFGGIKGDEILNDTWSYEEGIWNQLNLNLSPPGRHLHSLFYDEVRQSFVIYGGRGEIGGGWGNAAGVLSDMWELVIP
jgi:hypothetical protein